MLRTTAALVGFIAALCFVMAARAKDRRIAVLQPDQELLRGVSLALAPWGIETTGSNVPLPKSSQPEAGRVAAWLAQRLQVEALVWITTLDEGSLLWVFDVRTGDVTTRQLSQTPPFDGAAAAAVALSVKTVLRATAVAPPEERFGSQPTPPLDGPATEEASVAALEVGAESHWLSKGERDYRIRLSGIFWFPRLPSFGLGLQLSSGPGLRIDHPDYTGSYREIAAGARARFRLLDMSGVSAIVALGGAAHWAKLRGTLAAESRQSSVDRLNASVAVDALLNFDVTEGLYLGASAGAAYTPTYRRYLVDGRPIFAPWPLTANLTGYCGVELF